MGCRAGAALFCPHNDVTVCFRAFAEFAYVAASLDGAATGVFRLIGLRQAALEQLAGLAQDRVGQ